MHKPEQTEAHPITPFTDIRAVPEQRETRLILRVDPVEIDFDARRVRVQGRAVHVPERELQVLTHLMEHAGSVVTREELMHQVWRTDGPDIHKSIEVHINRLRRRLRAIGVHPPIRTVRGYGYVFDLPDNWPPP